MRPAGVRDRRVQVLRPGAVSKVRGEQVQDPFIRHNRWAAIVDRPGSGGTIVDQFQIGDADTRFEMSWDSITRGINEDWQIYVPARDKYYNVRAVVEMGRREGLLVYTETRA